VNKLILFIYFFAPAFVRRWIIRKYVPTEPGLSDDLLSHALADKNPLVRQDALEAISKYNLWKYYSRIVPALKDHSSDVRLAAVRCLSKLRAPSAGDHIVKALRDPDARVRAEAARALIQFPKPKYQAALQKLAETDPNIQIKLVTLRSLEKIGVSEAFTHSIISDLRHACDATNNISIHRDVVGVLAAFPPGKDMQNALCGFLHHISADVRRTAMRALGRKGDREAIYYLSAVVCEGDQLNQLLDSTDAYLANQAIEKITARYPR
jgi:HEAT repeat protein